MNKEWNKQDVYVNDVLPKMNEVLALCKAHDIPFVATFQTINTQAGCKLMQVQQVAAGNHVAGQLIMSTLATRLSVAQASAVIPLLTHLLRNQ